MTVFDSNIFASTIVGDELYAKCRKLLREHTARGVETLDLAVAEVANTLWKHVVPPQTRTGGGAGA